MGICVDPDLLGYDGDGRVVFARTPAVRIRNSAPQAKTSGGTTSGVVFDAVEFDNANMVQFDDFFIDFRIIKIPSPGLYLVAFNGLITAGNDYQTTEVSLRVNDPTVLGGFDVLRRGPETMPATGDAAGINPVMQLFEILEFDGDERLSIFFGQFNSANESRELLAEGAASANLTVVRLLPRI